MLLRGGGGISNCKSEGARGQPTGGLCRGGTFPLQPSRAGKFGSGLDPPRERCGRQDHGAPAHRPAPLGPQTALPFLLICFAPAPGRGGGAPGPRRLPGTRVGSAKERRACGSASRHLRFRVAGRGARETAGPAHVAGGPERGARRPPHNGDHRRPRASPPPRAPRALGAPEGSRTSLRGGGRGGERGPSSSSGRGRYLTPFSATPLRRPATPGDERAPIWATRPSPARPQSHHTHPWTPFSLLPPRSLNVRLPLAFPLGVALRRREARNLGRYHRARPRG